MLAQLDRMLAAPDPERELRRAIERLEVGHAARAGRRVPATPADHRGRARERRRTVRPLRAPVGGQATLRSTSPTASARPAAGRRARRAAPRPAGDVERELLALAVGARRDRLVDRAAGRRRSAARLAPRSALRERRPLHAACCCSPASPSERSWPGARSAQRTGRADGDDAARLRRDGRCSGSARCRSRRRCWRRSWSRSCWSSPRTASRRRRSPPPGGRAGGARRAHRRVARRHGHRGGRAHRTPWLVALCREPLSLHRGGEPLGPAAGRAPPDREPRRPPPRSPASSSSRSRSPASRRAASRAYLTHYLRPNPLLLPLHLISEVSRTVALVGALVRQHDVGAARRRARWSRSPASSCRCR